MYEDLGLNEGLVTQELSHEIGSSDPYSRFCLCSGMRSSPLPFLSQRTKSQRCVGGHYSATCMVKFGQRWKMVTNRILLNKHICTIKWPEIAVYYGSDIMVCHLPLLLLPTSVVVDRTLPCMLCRQQRPCRSTSE